MIVLTQSGGETIRLTLGSALNVDYSFFYIDTTDTPGLSRGTLGSTTPTDIVSAPGSGQRMIKSGFIHNRDSSPVVATVEIYATNGRKQAKYTIPADRTLFYEDGNGWFLDGTTEVEKPYLLYQDQKATSTDGGTFTSGAWRTRTLNTEVHDAFGLGSLASNQVTLQPGTYTFRGVATAIGVDRHQTKLYNATDATDIQLGTSEFTSSTDATVNTCSTVTGKFTLTTAKALELQHRCSTTRSTDGFGVGLTWGTNIFASLEFWKVA